jgi:UDP-glucose:(heptosyl)LPS alpha-1,3-glucosyltransferase
LGVAEQTIFAGGREDLVNFYRAADVFLHPARQETAGYALLEAMLCGVPQLITEECGYAFHVKRAGAGLVCPQPFRQETFNRLFAQMFALEARDKWKQNAADYCSATDLYSMVETMIDVIVRRAEKNRRAA